jgi:hypothetical protein
MRDSSTTQRNQVLPLLVAARGDWWPLPKITNGAAQYNARIFELRRLEFKIQNLTSEVDGVRHSWFRLDSMASVEPIKQAQATSTFPDGVSSPQFGSLIKKSHRVD